MKLRICAHASADDCFVVWRSDEPIAECVGYALFRKYLNGEKKGTIVPVNNRISFYSTEPVPFQQESSETSPFRRFSWTDHEVSHGDAVQYQVIPVLRAPSGDLLLDKDNASSFSKTATLSTQVDPGISCFFNRGFVISQFMTRMLGGTDAATLKKFKAHISEDTEDKIRLFLAGDQRERIVGLLDEAIASQHHLFAALYELGDEELLRKLESLSAQAHIVLSNDSYQDHGDPNGAVRQRLKDAGCDVADRILSGSGNPLGHNKFMVVCNAAQEPVGVWTGSMNWTTTGLCTQVNNSIYLEDTTLARIFLDQWDRLKQAGGSFPQSLVNANSKPKHAALGDAEVEVWFTRTKSYEDIDVVDALIDGAQNGILFLMFQPGASPLLNTILSNGFQRPGLYVCGVISTMQSEDVDQAGVSLIQRGGMKFQPFRFVQPEGIQNTLSHWAAEVTRSEFLGNIGYAIVHSKVIVIDPFGAKPVVVTGSHNFSKKASSGNDENLVIVRGSRSLARAYAVNINAAYEHYRWRAFVASQTAKHANPEVILQDETSWQDRYFTDPERKKELKFWLP
jgi:PLD-like domain